MASRIVNVDEIAKKGKFICLDDGNTYVIEDIQYSKPGKHGHAKYRLKVRDIFSNKKKDLLYSGHDEVKCPIVEKNRAQVLAVEPDSVQVIDLTTNDTLDLPLPFDEPLKEKLEPGVEVEYWVSEGKKGIVAVLS